MKIIATNITNLTDARYFAARGVDYLGFFIDSVESFLRIKAILDWVEGPGLLLEFGGQLDLSLREEFIQETKADGVINGDQINFRGEAVQPSHEQILFADQIEKLELHKAIQNPDRLFLIIRGTQEDKIGEKDFSDVDEILDWIEEAGEIG